MRLIGDKNLAIGVFSSRISFGKLAATFVVKAEASFTHQADARLIDEPRPLLSGDVASDEGEVVYSTDFSPAKLRADVIVKGTVHAPGGELVTITTAGYRIGNYQKQLQIVGDRSITRRTSGELMVSDTQPFTSMPLSYSRAYGGVGYSPNPVGQGRNSEKVPNVQYAQQPYRGPDIPIAPAGLGAVSASWAPRVGLTGTYDENWLARDWPWFPQDFDWHYFNAAPRDQQIEGYLRGDELLEFENLHAEYNHYQSALPSLRARCFVEIALADGKTAFREVPLNLDTLWIDMDEQKLVLIWRGLSEASTLKLKEVERVFAFTEPVSEPTRSVEEYYALVCERFLKSDEVEVDEAAEAAKEAARKAEFDLAFIAMDKELAAAEQEIAGHETLAERALAEQHAQMIASGADPATLAMPAVPKTLAESSIEMAAKVADLKKTQPEQAALLAEQLVGLQAAEKEVAELEEEAGAFEQEAQAEDEKKWTREHVEKTLRADRKLAAQNFSELNLADLDFSDVDLSTAILKGTDLSRSKFERCNLSGADLSGAILIDANLRSAILDNADFSAANLMGADCAAASLGDAVFSGLDLRGMNFNGCTGRAPDFSGSDLRNASFRNARLPQSDFSACQLQRADFIDAELQAARFNGAQGQHIQMAGADMAGAHAGEKSNFSSGDFRELKGAGSIWEQSILDGADFSRALLTRAQFSEASLRGTNLDRAHLQKAVFEDAILERAVMTNANMLRASFDRANLTNADMRGSNLFEAGFWEAIIYNTDLQHCNYRSTLLAQGHGYRITLEG